MNPDHTPDKGCCDCDKCCVCGSEVDACGLGILKPPFTAAEYMAANPPPTHTGTSDCNCRKCFFTLGRKGYWT